MPALSFDRQEGFAELHTLDSTVPPTSAKSRSGGLASALSICLEQIRQHLCPNIFEEYFLIVSETVGGEEAGDGVLRSPAPARSSGRSQPNGFRQLAYGVVSAPSSAPYSACKTASIPPGMSPRIPDARR